MGQRQIIIWIRPRAVKGHRVAGINRLRTRRQIDHSIRGLITRPGGVRVVDKEPRIAGSCHAIPQAHIHRIPIDGNTRHQLGGIRARGIGKDIPIGRTRYRGLARSDP